jgi:hypothetical protein
MQATYAPTSALKPATQSENWWGISHLSESAQPGFHRLSENLLAIAEECGLSEMTMEEIDAEVKAVRQERAARRRAEARH